MCINIIKNYEVIYNPAVETGCVLACFKWCLGDKTGKNNYQLNEAEMVIGNQGSTHD